MLGRHSLHLERLVGFCRERGFVFERPRIIFTCGTRIKVGNLTVSPFTHFTRSVDQAPLLGIHDAPEAEARDCVS